MKKQLICFFIFFWLFFFCLKNVKAASPENSISFKAAPLYFDLMANPGEEKEGEIYLENTSQKDLIIDSSFSDFFVDIQGNYIFTGQKEVQNEELKPYLMRDWFSEEESEFSLKKGESRTVKYKINIPAYANLGGHYGAIFFKTRCGLEKDKAVVYSDTSQLCVSGNIGILFLLQVGGDAQKKGVIQKIDIPRITASDSAKISVKIANEGNAHFKPEGKITVDSLTGKEIYQMDIKDKTLLPQRNFDFEGTFKREGLLGIYRVNGNIKDGNNNNMVFKRWIFMADWKDLIILLIIVVLAVWVKRNYKIKKVA
jgi:hypothetical protein